MRGVADRMSKTETVQDFKSVDDFEDYCYHVCPVGDDPVEELGCRLRCKIVVELKKKHPDWFGA